MKEVVYYYLIYITLGSLLLTVFGSIIYLVATLMDYLKKKNEK